MFLCTKSIHWLVLVAACCNLIPAGFSSTEIWRSGGMARSACQQWEEFNKTGVIPPPIKDGASTQLCGWFSKGIQGDACADIRHFWLGCKIPNATNRIIGGSKARKQKFPSFVQMGGRCGASIINEEWALLAGHCVSNQRPGQNILDSDRKYIASTTEYFLHPEYDPSIVLNDIGLVKFAPKANWTERLQPVRLPNENSFYTKGIIGVSIGMGEGSNETLYETELPVITTERCREIFDAHVEKEDNVTITDDYICGQYPEGDVRNLCYGDSGGPFYACEDNKLVQVGVATFTGGCYTHYPAGYMRVTKYLTWIKETIAKNSN